MKHLFIPYELAVIAKEKGFNERCFTYYYNGVLQSISGLSGPSKGEVINAPIYQQIVDWFRTKHRILIHQVLGFHNQHWCFKLQNIKIDPKNIDTIQEKTYYDTFNKAIEEAFKLI